MKKHLNLIYRIEGEKIEQGIDVYELAPALLALADLINQGHKSINQDHSDLGINIKPFEKGSFLVDIALFAKDNLQHLMDFTNSQEATKIKQTLELIGLISKEVGIPAGGLIGLLLWLKGKPKKVEPIEKNKYKITSKEGSTIIVEGDVYNLYNNENVLSNAGKAYGKLLNQEGVSTVESYLKDQPSRNVKIDKNDYEAIENSAGLVNKDEEHKDEEANQNIVIMYLQPKRGSYEGAPTHWSFYVGSDKKESITATIKDQGFLDRINSGQLRPHHTDLLKVQIKTTQIIKGNEIKTKREILKILEHIEAPSQNSF